VRVDGTLGVVTALSRRVAGCPEGRAFSLDLPPRFSTLRTIGFGISSKALGDVTIATSLGVPRSRAHEWLGAAPTLVVNLEVAILTEPELRQEILGLRRRIEKLAALLRSTLALLHTTSGFRLSGERLPGGQ